MPSAWASDAFTQGWKLAGAEIREGEREVPHVALGVDDQRRNPGEQGLLEQDDGQARLARPGHADDHAVGREVTRADHEIVRAGLAGRRVENLAQMEGAAVCHSYESKGRARRIRR